MPGAPKRLEKVNNKITWKEYLENTNNYPLIEVRSPLRFKICSINGSINIQKG